MTALYHRGRRSNYKWWAFAAVAIGFFTLVMDQSGVMVALPTIADHFKIGLPTAQWVIVGYVLTISTLLLPMGRLSDIVGLKQVYVAGFVIFILGAGLAGASTNIIALILSRLLQGLGGAMTQGTGLAIITSAFPGSERGKVMGLVLSVVGVGSIAGTPLAGLLVSALDWRWVFFTTVLTSVPAILGSAIILDKKEFSQHALRPKFDWLGAALSAGALASFLTAMTNGPRTGWSSPPVIVAALLFLLLLVTFIWWELRAPAPMLELRVFKRGLFSLGVVAGFISFTASAPVRFLMPFYLQKVLGYSPAQVGLILVPSALCMIVMGPLSGSLSDRYGWRIFNVSGIIFLAAGVLLMSRVAESSSLGLPMAGMMLQSAGMGMFDTTNNSSILGTVERDRYGVVAGLLNLVRNSANITGVAVSTAIVTGVMASMDFPPSLEAVSGGGGVLSAFTSGLRAVYLAMGCLLLVGLMVSLLKGGRSRESVAPESGSAPEKGGVT